MRSSSSAPSGHMYVLDNGTDRLLDSESISDYRPVLTFAATGELDPRLSRASGSDEYCERQR